MNKHIRRSFKVVAWLCATAVILVAAQVAVLARPARWFDHTARVGNLTFYSDRLTGGDLEKLARDVRHRLEATDLYNEETEHRVFVCADENLYHRFTRLARVPPSVPGFNLSVLNNSFVSVSILERRRSTNRAGVENSAIAGGLEQCITHELIHDYVQERIGFFAVQGLPRWKTEGHAEFESNRSSISKDPDETLARRIRWMQSASMHERAREYYEWNLVVEYLITERGYSFSEVMADNVTFGAARRQMMAWSAGE